MKSKLLLLILLITVGINTVIAQYSVNPFQRKVFIENKGQFSRELPKEYQDFEYCIDNGTQILFKNNELIYHFVQTHEKEWMEEEKREKEEGITKTEEEEEREHEKFKPTHQYIKMQWLEANPSAKIEVRESDGVKYGYIRDVEGKGKPKDIACKGYKRLVIHDLYEGVDAEYFFTEKEGEVKYNLYVNETADVSKIKFKYDGEVNVRKGNIYISTLKGEMIEYAPLTYKAFDKERIPSSFQINENNEFNFVLNNQATQSITIDPLIAVPGLGGQAPVDNGVDQLGNHYVSSKQFILEKYTPSGNLVFSTNVLNANYYGDMLTSSTGQCFFNTVGFHPRGDATSVDANGNFIWDSFGITECWRFVLNECYGQVYSLTGYRHTATGFATIDASTGALSNYSQSGNCCYDPHCGVVDNNGDVYTVASDPSTIHHWSPTNVLLSSMSSPIPFGYGTGYAGLQGYNGMAFLGDFLYLHNGATIAKVNKLTGALVGQRAVPNGAKSGCGGIYITSCGYLLIGSTSGVYMFDSNLNQLDFRATNGAVYDLQFNDFNQNFAVCGPGHVSEVDFNIPPCVFETHPVIVPSCNGTATGSIELNLSGGVPPYTYTWSGNGLTGNTDKVTGLLPGTYTCDYADSRCPTPTQGTVTVTVGVQTVVAEFTSEEVCLGESTVFQNNSTTSVGSINTIAWDFGDNSTSNLTSPTHLYASDGSFPVQLTVTATNNCSKSITHNAVVSPLPVASFTNPRECNNEAVDFASTSTVSSGSITNWDWNFGDGDNSTSENPSHQFPMDVFPFLHSYDVNLKVTTDKGCVDDVTVTYTPYPMPKSEFSFENACVNTPIQFTNLSNVVAPDNLMPAIFNFGDGSGLVNADTPIHSYTVAGDYSVSMISTTNNGCIKDTSITITIYPEPVANFTSTIICENEPPTVFTNQSTISSGTIQEYNWNFGTATSAMVNPSHDFAGAGTYQVSLTVVSDYNCENTITNPVVVKPAPVSKFIVDDPEGCATHCVEFTNVSISNSNTIISNVWNFGNGTSVLDVSPTECFTNTSHVDDSSFNVELITENDLGCYDTLFLENYITVFHNPVAKFTPSALEENMYEAEFEMTNNSIGADGYVWGFGDNASSDVFEPVHVYSDTGVYQITLVSYTNNNCYDTTYQSITIVPVISIYIPNAFTPNGDGNNDVFKFEGYGIVKEGFEFYVFDRWGNQLFFTDVIDRGWDGTYKGKEAQQDTYVYKLICKDYFGEEHEERGHVNLLR